MGGDQAVQPVLSEVTIRPTLVSLSVCHRPPRTPLWSVVNMRSVHTQRFAQSTTDVGVPAGVAANGTVAGWVSLRAVISHPPSCVPFAPRALPRFVATTDALTPVRRLFVHALPVEPGLRHMNTVLSVQVSLCHAIEPSDRSNSNHLLPSRGRV